jgi:hypothetical protein
MPKGRQNMRRILGGARTDAAADSAAPLRVEQARQVRNTLIDFPALKLPADVTHALADAFWNHFGVRNERCILVTWANLKVFGRFAAESAALKNLADLNRTLLVRYVEWLNTRQRASGKSWTKSSRSTAYTTLRKLLQWLERCRPGVLGSIEYPFNPFPWRNRDTQPMRKLTAAQLRAILKACERDIAATRAQRAQADVERAAARDSDRDPASSRGALLATVERRYGGILPPWKTLQRLGGHAILRGLQKFGGGKEIAPLLYPDANSILPYYPS